MRDIVLRPATLDDSNNLYDWRNHPRIRAVSQQTGAFERDSHERWLRETLDSPRRVLLIGEVPHLPENPPQAIGVLRYDISPSKDAAVVSIYLVPDYIGQGYGTPLLLAGHDWLRMHQATITTVIANIRPDNPASTKAFQKAHYQRTDPFKPSPEFVTLTATLP